MNGKQNKLLANNFMIEMKMFMQPAKLLLNFFILAKKEEEVSSIKNILSLSSDNLSFIKGFTSVKYLINASSLLEKIDFIAVDNLSFSELIKEDFTTTPLIVFNKENNSPIQPHQLVFDQVFSPVNQTALTVTLNKLENIKKIFGFKKMDEPIPVKEQNPNKTFLTKRGKEFLPVSSDSIPVFYTDNKITFAYDNSGKKFLINQTLIELESTLDKSLFFRANRQYLVNRKFITKIKQLEEGRFEIVVDMGEILLIEINQQKFSRLKEWIETN